MLPILIPIIAVIVLLLGISKLAAYMLWSRDILLVGPPATGKSRVKSFLTGDEIAPLDGGRATRASFRKKLSQKLRQRLTDATHVDEVIGQECLGQELANRLKGAMGSRIGSKREPLIWLFVNATWYVADADETREQLSAKRRESVDIAREVASVLLNRQSGGTPVRVVVVATHADKVLDGDDALNRSLLKALEQTLQEHSDIDDMRLLCGGLNYCPVVAGSTNTLESIQLLVDRIAESLPSTKK